MVGRQSWGVMNEYSFEVRLRAVVRVRASSKEEASKVVESVLGSPSNSEIGLANQNNAAVGLTATVVAVDLQHTSSPRPFSDNKPRTARHAA
jgi:hypothetical protein